MILSASENHLIASCGWVERNAIVRHDLRSGVLERYEFARGEYVRLWNADGNRFLAAVYAPSEGGLSLSVRLFEAPQVAQWNLELHPGGVHSDGDPSALLGLPRHFLSTVAGETKLVTLREDGRSVGFTSLPWYTNGPYDHRYQGLTDVGALQNSPHVLISVQRSSTIGVCDPEYGRLVETIGLADRGGNPMLTIEGNMLLTVDYDTFVKVDLRTRCISCRLRIQGTARDDLRSERQEPVDSATRQFAGDLFHWPHAGLVAIPRPFSGDVVAVDPRRCEIVGVAPTGGRPLSCVVTNKGRVIARDWQSGDWLEGYLSGLPGKPRDGE